MPWGGRPRGDRICVTVHSPAFGAAHTDRHTGRHMLSTTNCCCSSDARVVARTTLARHCTLHDLQRLSPELDRRPVVSAGDPDCLAVVPSARLPRCRGRPPSRRRGVEYRAEDGTTDGAQDAADRRRLTERELCRADRAPLRHL